MSDHSRNRRHVDDRATAAILHDADSVLAAEKHAVEVDRHQVAPLLQRRRLDVLEQHHTGIVDENVDAAEVARHRIGDRDPLVLAGDVEPMEARALPQLSDRRCRCGFIAIGHDDRGAFIHEQPCRGKADARCAARDQRNLVLHATHGAANLEKPVADQANTRPDASPERVSRPSQAYGIAGRGVLAFA